jgi:ABC-type transporter Mla subunit MlaD
VDSSLEIDGDMLGQLLWSTDASGPGTPIWVFVVALLAGVVVYGPLLVRIVRILLLERAVRDASRLDDRAAEVHRSAIAAAFSSSPLASQWEEFDYRWRGALAEGDRQRAPIRLLDIFDERPLIPTGAIKSLLPALPGLFLAIGVTGTFVGLAAAITEGTADASTVGGLVGDALESSLWGLFAAIAATLTGRLLVGTIDRLAESLDHLVERAFGAVSTGEMASLWARSQRDSLLSLGAELTRFTFDLTERIDRGLQRIEHSTATAAGLISEEQRNVLKNVVNELSVQVQTGVADHLSALRDVLGRAVDHQGSVTGGLTEAFDRMAANSRAHAQVTVVLEQAAVSVRDAASTMSDTSIDLAPLLDRLRDIGVSLADTALSMRTTQETVASNADGIRLSIEHATAALSEQREFIETGLGEVRSTLELMSIGLGENLSSALRSVDDALDHTIGRLRETIESSNETIDRMSVPVRAAEGTSREMHTALERVRVEIAGLGDWLGQAVRPLRGTLAQLEDRAGDISRALTQFGDRAQHIDKTVDALRGEIHEEGRRLRASNSELARHLQSVAEVAIGLSAGDSAARRDATPAPAASAAPVRHEGVPQPAGSATRASATCAPHETPVRSDSSPDPAITSPGGPSHTAVTRTADPAPPASTSSGGWTRVPVPSAGTAAAAPLGRDPYARGTGSHTLLERQRRILESDPTEQALAIEEISDEHATDEPTLSGLLSKPSPAAGAATTSRIDRTGTAVQPTGDEAPPACEEATDEAAAAPDLPRTWQLLGRD